MVNEPLVSVVIPVYNGERFLVDTIDSVLNQSYTNMEVIIVDDLSTDNSRTIIDRYEDKRIIRVYKEKNENVCGATNEGLLYAKGKYCALIGHDDSWTKDKIEKQVAFLEQNNEYGVCFSRCNVIDQNGNIINNQNELYRIFNSYENDNRYVNFLKLFFNGNALCAPTALIRMDLMMDLKGYDFSLLQLQDYDLWLRILLKTNLFVMNEVLVDYRQILDTKTNISTINETNIRRSEFEYIYVREKIIASMEDDLFSHLFKGYFNDKKSSTNKELLCEKTLLLRKMGNPYWLKMYSENINDDQYRILLNEKYNYSLQDFYKDSAQKIFYKPQSGEAKLYKAEQEDFISYIDYLISLGEIKKASSFYKRTKEFVDTNTTIEILGILFYIYDMECEQKEYSVFEGRTSLKSVEEHYIQLKFLLRRYDFNIEQCDEEVVSYIVENHVSSSLILCIIQRSIINKIAVLNRVARLLINNGNELISLKLLKCAYNNSKDDETILNLAYVMYCCGYIKEAKKLLGQIKCRTDVVRLLEEEIDMRRG